jgi:hypothetical protein
MAYLMVERRAVKLADSSAGNWVGSTVEWMVDQLAENWVGPTVAPMVVKMVDHSAVPTAVHLADYSVEKREFHWVASKDTNWVDWKANRSVGSSAVSMVVP